MHSKLTIGTKINIIQGFILKIWGWYPPNSLWLSAYMKITWFGRGLTVKAMHSAELESTYQVMLFFFPALSLLPFGALFAASKCAVLGYTKNLAVSLV